jgi:hypothetical protein
MDVIGRQAAYILISWLLGNVYALGGNACPYLERRTFTAADHDDLLLLRR